MVYLRLTCIVLVVLAMYGCVRTKSAHLTSEEAKVVVKHIGFKSGCQYVLVTSKGEHFIPVQVQNDDLILYAGSTLRIHYNRIKDPVYACTSMGIPIQILSGKEIESGRIPGTGGIKQVPSLCAWTTGAYDIPWMVQIIKQIDPWKITRFKWYEGGAYWFESKKGHYLFDCRGEFLCFTSIDVKSLCLEDPALSDPYVILVRNE